MSRPTRASHPGGGLRAAGGYLATVALGAGLLLTASGALASPGPDRPTATSGAVDQVAPLGRELFLQSCAACHGVSGEGTANGPAIQSAGPALADFMLRTGRMPLAEPNAPVRRSTPAFDQAQIDALVAYVASLGAGPAIPDVVVDGADLTRGRDLFTTNCAACHGPAGGGGAVGGGFVAPDLSRADPATVGEAALTGPGPMPRFSFDPAELDDLAAYVQFLRSAPDPGGASAPGVGPVTEGFVAGVALIGLLLVAGWVAVRREPGA